MPQTDVRARPHHRARRIRPLVARGRSTPTHERGNELEATVFDAIVARHLETETAALVPIVDAPVLEPTVGRSVIRVDGRSTVFVDAVPEALDSAASGDEQDLPALSVASLKLALLLLALAVTLAVGLRVVLTAAELLI